MVAVPAAVPVKVTEHEPEASVHVVALKVPAEPVLDHVTVPVGVVTVPGDVSVTVAVQVEGTLIATGVVHATAVVVFRLLTVTVEEPALPLWIASPPYVPVITAEPVAVAVKVT